MFTKITATTAPINSNKKEQVRNCNTDLCVDLKTFLLTDRITKIGKDYTGVLTRDREDHYTFLESLLSADSNSRKRNPHVYEGVQINVNRRDDGTLYPTFNRPRYTRASGFQVFCREAAHELMLVAGFLGNNQVTDGESK